MRSSAPLNAASDTARTSLDIKQWLQANGEDWKKHLMLNSVIPLLEHTQLTNKLTSDDVNSIYRLFIDEPDKTVANLMADLLNLFPIDSPELKYAHDFIAIFQFLRNGKKFIKCIDKLEIAVQAYAATCPEHDKLIKDTSGNLTIDTSRLVINGNFQTYKTHKIFSGYLYAWAASQGFTNKVKILRTLREDEFQALLTIKSFIKDSASSLDPLHGMWAHTIQWWCIFQHHADTQFLQHPVLELYQQFGKSSSKFWDNIFDNVPGTPYFTCPEELTETIVDDDRRWPLLSTSLFKQKLKLSKYSVFSNDYRDKLRQKHGEDVVVISGVELRPFSKHPH